MQDQLPTSCCISSFKHKHQGPLVEYLVYLQTCTRIEIAMMPWQPAERDFEWASIGPRGVDAGEKKTVSVKLHAREQNRGTQCAECVKMVRDWQALQAQERGQAVQKFCFRDGGVRQLEGLKMGEADVDVNGEVCNVGRNGGERGVIVEG
ncbi:hypothetical protein B0H17DRAFT_1143721 [Mycena rosella]|uniref:Uncharacterized protein n=1 Tax=Mycena rosella TaxID=1033263 RepID=A0AAD7CUC1_MYCRO|nr:hypothetical protein B0H17DRAFT_1143721 [Mycena rosella]